MTTVRKRDPRLEEQYYVSGNTVRRNAPSAQWQTSQRQTAQRQAAQRQTTQRQTAQRYAPQHQAAQRGYAQWEPATRSYSREEAVRTRRSENIRRANEPRSMRYAEPLREVRTRQGQRDAASARAYAAQMEAQRIEREERNMRTAQQHRQWQRAAAERRRREEEARIAAEELAEQRRRAQQRVRAFAAVLAIVMVLTGAAGIFTLLNRYIAIDKMTGTQRSLQAQIADQQKRLEELQVEVNKQSNIAQVQDYARESLNMDYAQKENIRVIELPGE